MHPSSSSSSHPMRTRPQPPSSSSTAAERLGEPLVTVDDKLHRRLAHLALVLAPDEALKSGLG